MKLENLGTPVISNMSTQNDLRVRLNESSAVLYSALRNLYSDLITSTTREIFSNCVDSVIQANSDIPIEIWLNNDNIIFKDFGMGMNFDTINEVYLSMGSSTKNDSNELIGMYGLGSKSPLCLSDAFTLESIYDGIKNGFLIYIDETEHIRVKHSFTQETNDYNGTIVKIPIKKQDRASWEKAVLSIIKFFPNQTKLFGITQQKIISPVIEGDKWAIYPGNLDQVNILYANLPYSDTTSGIPNNVVLKFNVGEINLTPSREMPRYTEKTKLAIKDAIQAFRTEIVDLVRDQIDNAEKFEDVVRVVHSMPEWNTSKEYVWKNKKFNYPLVGTTNTIIWFDRKYGTKLQLHHARDLNPYSYSSANAQFLDKEVIILDKEINSYDRQRISYHMKENTLARVYLIKSDQLPVTGPNLSEIKVKRPGSGGPRQPRKKKTEIKGKLLGHYGGRASKRSFPIDSAMPVVYHMENDPDLHYTWKNLISEILVITEKDEKLIIGKANWMKFYDYVENKCKNLLTLQEAERIANNIKNSNDWNKLSFLAAHFDEFKPTKLDPSITDEQEKYVQYLVAKGDVIPQSMSFYKKYPLLEPLRWIGTEYYDSVVNYVRLVKKDLGEI